MKHKEFIHRLDEKRIATAIAAAEAKTSGEIRAFISRRKCTDPLAVAEMHFKALGMARTKNRNAILLFIAPKSQAFAIYGDIAIHSRCGAEFWNILRDEMTAALKESRYTDALVHGITRAGDLLAVHFPPDKENPNEHPDTLLRD